jgi:hypothetical protein
VAISLVVEVMDYVTGTDLTPTERYVLVVIAERASEKSRKAWQQAGKWSLAERVGISDRGLRKVLAGLAERGLEVRVPLSVSPDGRPTYAANGHQTTYLLPPLKREGGTPVPAKGGTTVPPKGGTTKQKGGTTRQKGGTAVPPYTSDTSDTRATAAPAREPRTIVMEATGATPAEADAIVKRIHAERNPKNLSGFLRHLAASGDLGQYLTDVRAAAARYADDNDRKIRQGMPRCEHGVAGGTQAHTVTGLIRCGACRTRSHADRLNGTARVIPLRAQEVS